ncbi:mCG141280, partial [Mus musculus]
CKKTPACLPLVCQGVNSIKSSSPFRHCVSRGRRRRQSGALDPQGSYERPSSSGSGCLLIQGLSSVVSSQLLLSLTTNIFSFSFEH